MSFSLAKLLGAIVKHSPSKRRYISLADLKKIVKHSSSVRARNPSNIQEIFFVQKFWRQNTKNFN